jgi:hypothetical protein
MSVQGVPYVSVVHFKYWDTDNVSIPLNGINKIFLYPVKNNNT